MLAFFEDRYLRKVTDEEKLKLLLRSRPPPSLNREVVAGCCLSSCLHISVGSHQVVCILASVLKSFVGLTIPDRLR